MQVIGLTEELLATAKQADLSGLGSTEDADLSLHQHQTVGSAEHNTVIFMIITTNDFITLANLMQLGNKKHS